MAPVAKSKSEEILENLSNFKMKQPGLEFTLKRFEKEATHLLKNEPVSAYNILGAIACLKEHIEEMHSYHQKAITASGQSSESLMNYSTSLMRLGFVEAAYLNAKDAHKKHADLYNTCSLSSRAAESGRFIEAYELVRDIEDEDLIDITPDHKIFRASVSALVIENNLADDDIAKVITAITSVFHQSGIFGYEEKQLIKKDERGRFILTIFDFPPADVDLLTLDYDVEKAINALDVDRGVFELLEFDFSTRNTQNSNDVSPLSMKKIERIRDLVAPVEI